MLDDILGAIISLFWDPSATASPTGGTPEPNKGVDEDEQLQDMQRVLLLAVAGYRHPDTKTDLLEIAKSSLNASPDLYWEYMCHAVMVALDRFGVPASSYRLTTDEVLQRVLRAKPANASTETCASSDDMRTAISLIWDTDLYDVELRHARYEYGNFAAEDMIEATYVPIIRTFTTLANWDGINQNLPSDETGEDLIRIATETHAAIWPTERS